MPRICIENHSIEKNYYRYTVYLYGNTCNYPISTIKYSNDDISDRGQYGYAHISAIKHAIYLCKEFDIAENQISIKDCFDAEERRLSFDELEKVS